MTCYVLCISTLSVMCLVLNYLMSNGHAILIEKYLLSMFRTNNSLEVGLPLKCQLAASYIKLNLSKVITRGLSYFGRISFSFDFFFFFETRDFKI